MNKPITLGLMLLCTSFIANTPTLADGVPCGHLDLIGSYETTDSSSQVELVGDMAYVLNRKNGLYIFDVSDPTQPSLTGIYSSDARIYTNLTIRDTVAYLGTIEQSSNSTGKLHIIDIADPTSPQLISSYETQSFIRDFEIQGSTAYILELDALIAVDISNLKNPTTIGTLNTVRYAKKLELDGDTAFVIDVVKEWGIQSIDISDPTFSDPSAAQIGFLPTLTLPTEITISDHIAFLAFDTTREIRIFDVNTPSAITHLGTYKTIGFPNSTTIVGSTAYISSFRTGLEIVDISDFSHPTLMGTSSTPNLILDSAIQADMAFAVGYDSGLQIIDISTPDTPYIGAYQTVLEPEYATVMNIEYKDNTIFAASREHGLEMIDISSTDTPVLIGKYQPKGEIIQVELAGDLAFVLVESRVEEEQGIHILDISDPTTPVLLHRYPSAPAVYDFAVANNTLYALDYQFGLHIIDVHNPSSPIPQSALPFKGLSQISIAGTMAYLAEEGIQGGLVVVDVADPSKPTLLTVFDDFAGNGTLSVLADKDIVYLTTLYDEEAEWDGGLHVIDVSTPRSPTLLGSYESEAYGHNPLLQDDTLYLTDGFAGLRLIDVSEPANPTLIGSFYPGLGAQDTEVIDGIAYVASTSAQGGFSMIDVNPDCRECLADFTSDGVLNFFDVSAFLQAFNANDPIADFTNDEVWNFFDISAFLQAFAAGCP